MRVITKTAGMQRFTRSCRLRGVRVGFVPTMGYLHKGHLALITRARASVGSKGAVAVSIYVNPAQFGPNEDLSSYPRDFPTDRQLCREAGVDVVFAPDDAQMYPGKESGAYSTYVVEQSLSNVMEGVARPTHFRGVTTVVAKLFNLVQPEVAVFGAKDFQQAVIANRMVSDLAFPLKIIVLPTVREPDGLAMSSRNKYLDGELRSQAVALWQAIQEAKRTVQQSKNPVRAVPLKKQLREFIERRPAARVDYIEFFDPATLQPQEDVGRGSHLALAVFIGKTRLIDNARL